MEKHFAKMNPLFPDKNHKQIYPSSILDTLYLHSRILKHNGTIMNYHIIFMVYLCKLKHRIENMFDLNEVIGTLNKE